MQIKHSYLSRVAAVAALTIAFIVIGYVQNTQAQAASKIAPLTSDHKAEGEYKRLRSGTHAPAAYLAAYQHAQAVPAAANLPATHRASAGGASVQANQLPSGRWTSIGPAALDTNLGDPAYIGVTGPNAGRMVTIVTDPTAPGTLYTAASGGGVWKSTNDGASWLPTTDNMPTLEMGALAIDPTNPKVLYAGTGENDHCADCGYGLGIYKTTDGAASWQMVGGSTFTTVIGNAFRFNVLAVDARVNQYVWAGTNHGLYRSFDGGNTWYGVGTSYFPFNNSNFQASDIVIDTSTNPSTVYVAVNAPFGGNAGSGVFKTADNGNSWTDITPSLITDRTQIGRTALGMSKAAPGVVYMMVNSATEDLLGTTFDSNGYPSANGLIYKTSNGGGSWVQYAAPNVCNAAHLPGFGQCSYDIYITADPINPSIVYMAGVNIARSTDSGATWTDITTVYDPTPSPVHPDQHYMTFAPPAAGQSYSPLYIANDGGIYKSGDTGTTWASLNSNLATLEVYVTTGGTNFANQRLAWSGMQDNGANKYTGDPVWDELFGGDGGYTAIDPTDQRIVYEEYVGLVMSKSTDGGASWSSATNGLPQNANLSRLGEKENVPGALFIAPFIIDPNPANHMHLIAGSDAVFETIDGANTWCQISPVFSGAALGKGTSVSALAIAPSTSAQGAETIYAGLKDGHVYVTTTGFIAHGATTCPALATWTEVDSGIPVSSAPFVTAIAVDQTNPQQAYLSTSFGGNSYALIPGPHTFKTSNGGASWVGMDGTGASALPNVNANALITYATDTGSAIVAGMDQGAYVSADQGATWQALRNGLPNAPINYLAMDFAHSTILASTHSRGVFAMPIPQTDVSQGIGDTVGEFDANAFNIAGEFLLRNSLTTGDPDINTDIGQPTDIGVVGDWTGHGTSGIGVFRPRTTQFILKDSNAPLAPAAHVFTYGFPNGIPVVGDWTGSGHKSIGIYNPAQGAFYLRNSLTSGFADELIVFGPANSIPVVGDWNGDGIDTVGIYSNGVFMLTDQQCVNTTCAIPLADYYFGYGLSGDLPVIGDWLHQGRSSVGVLRPSNGVFYLHYGLNSAYADTALTISTTLPVTIVNPVAGHWNDSGSAYQSVNGGVNGVIVSGSSPATKTPATAAPVPTQHPASSYDG